jgi:addiction module HigA family antidote
MPRPAIPPGEILADELRQLGVSPVPDARELQVPANRICQILAGKQAITADTALRLGQWSGTGPELWLNLQPSYELRRAEQTSGSEILATVSRLSVSESASV